VENVGKRHRLDCINIEGRAIGSAEHLLNSRGAVKVTKILLLGVR
jgi:hypothetical protein